MAFKHERIDIGNQFVSTLDRAANQWSDLWIHPRFDDPTNRVVILICFETVDCESWRVDAELDPSKKKLWAWLRPFEAANVMAVTLGIVSKPEQYSAGKVSKP